MKNNNLLKQSTLVLALMINLNLLGQINYSLVSGNESWPEDKRIAIINVMDEAVKHYNNHGYFEKTITVEYNPDVPTADANSNGHIRFGGSISAQTALHEIAHTLGIGTVPQWSAMVGNDHIWKGEHANARIQLYNGENALIACDGYHFWSNSGATYGLNQSSEDGSTNRIRHVKMVSALRWDMGLVKDSDQDGMPDDWEMFYFQNLNHTGVGDYDQDGISNLDEYKLDRNPTSIYEWVKVDDRDTSVIYDENWGLWPSNPSYETTVHYSEVTGANAIFTFNGTQVRFYGFKRNDLGHVDIYIDDDLQTSIDCYASSTKVDHLLYESPVLEYGTHILKLVVSGNKNEESSGTEIICDAFEFFEGPKNSTVATNELEYNTIPFSVFPNPANHEITIQCPSDKNVQVSIYDLQGRSVYLNSFRNKIQIDKTDLHVNGVLFVKLSSDGRSETKMILIK